MGQLNRMLPAKVVTTVTSLAFSSSGRVLFAGHDDFTAYAWDTLTGQVVSELNNPHDNRVSCLGVPKDGKALATGSWDMLLKVRNTPHTRNHTLRRPLTFSHFCFRLCSLLLLVR